MRLLRQLHHLRVGETGAAANLRAALGPAFGAGRERHGREFVARVRSAPAAILGEHGPEQRLLRGLPEIGKCLREPAAFLRDAHIVELRGLDGRGRQIGEERRANPTDDLVSRLIHSEVDGDQLTPLEYCNMFQILILAGNETTRTTLTHGMKAFIDNPDQLALLKAQPELMSKAVEEILRWATPVLYMRRTAMEDTVLRGAEIAKGDKVVMWYMSANYDEDVFDDPHTFDIARDPNPHLGFGGGGPHFCLGAWLARLQIRVMLEELIARDLHLASNGPVRRVRSNFVNGVKSMPVRVV